MSPQLNGLRLDQCTKRKDSTPSVIVCLSHALGKLKTSYLLQPATVCSVADMFLFHRFGLGRVCLEQMIKKRL